MTEDASLARDFLPLKITSGEERVTGRLTSLVSASGGRFRYSAPKHRGTLARKAKGEKLKQRKQLT